MRLKFAIWMLPVFVSVACADEVTCNAGAASIPVFDPSSLSGAVGDYTLDCTGGTPVTPTPLVDFTAFMNVPVLNTGGWILTNGVSEFAGSLGSGNVVEFLSVPFNPPGAGHVDWEVENIFVNPSVLQPGSEFREVVEIGGQLSPTIVNPDQLVAVNAPEPSSLLLTAVVLGGISWSTRRRQRPASSQYNFTVEGIDSNEKSTREPSASIPNDAVAEAALPSE